jgi:hypothetical protein
MVCVLGYGQRPVGALGLGRCVAHQQAALTAHLREGGPTHIGFWDDMTFLAFLVIAVGFIAALVFLLGMPGKIAYDDRKHPDS